MSDTTTDLHGFVRACAVADIPDTNALGVRLGDLAVAVVRSNGEYYALHDVCSHAEVALSEGDVDGDVIDCWLHGSEFDLRTGKPLCLPATDPVAVYPVKLEDGVIYVNVD
ncbi:non-heme iron oxygenase ferredoxin subunit, partial [Nocardioides sp.]|uniref:non-heme iron oxygenase ferredoxin subunit n=1 Tax=Nocardioides sp. TaxID=35761 RepID=UPI00286E2BB4